MAGIGKGLGWVFGLSTVSLVGFVVFGYAESKSPQSVGRSTGRPVNRIPTGGIPVKANTSSEGYPVGLPPTSAENPVGVEQQPYTPTPYPTVAPVEQVPYNPPVGNQSPAINRSQNPCPEGIGSHTDTLGNIVCEYPPQNYAPEFLDEFINPKENASLTTEQMWDSLSEEEQQAIWGDYTRRQQTVTWDGYHKEDYFLYPHAG